jgi:Protein of unknown function (DUF3131)
MSFVKGLLAARSHAAFLLGLALAVVVMLEARSWERAQVRPAIARQGLRERLGLDASAPTPRGGGKPLSDEEREWARVAWRYFENNTQPSTGLVNAADSYPSTSLWDVGSSVFGLVAAGDLGLIDAQAFDSRMARLLASLEVLPLVDGALPNKAYNTATLHSVNYDNSEAPAGLGWSAIDLGRLAAAFSLVSWSHPEETPAIRRVLERWNLRRAARDGFLVGATRRESGEIEEVRETSFGYEAYAAKGLFLVGGETSRSRELDTDLPVTSVSGQLVMHDPPRPSGERRAHDAVVSEPFVLEGIEYGWDQRTLPLAQSVLLAQMKRRATTGILTAVSEDNIDRAPYFIYGTVIDGEDPWATVAPDGSDARAHRAFSTKAALGWAYLFSGAYSKDLLAGVEGLMDPQKGFFAGRYEAGGTPNKALTVNTNGVILEILAYETRGPLLPAATRQR